MQSDTHQTDSLRAAALANKGPEQSLYRVIFRNSIWLLGILTWLFGVFDRGYAIFVGQMFTPANFFQLLTVVSLFGGWLYLKPESSTESNSEVAFRESRIASVWQQPHYLGTVQTRMSELQPDHLVGREYILPFPYLCQIYHLLNLKHLETVHSFSLNNLKVLGVQQFQPTAIGGKLRFQTALESPLNILRFWRQHTVEVELTLHTPFTVELQIPVRDNKFVIVIFNVLPVAQGEHKFFVDIYSNLPWPKALLRFVLEFATSLTLLEDLPYLRQLATLQQQNLLRSGNAQSSLQGPQQMMQLFNHYVQLYSSAT
jgi:hypothetical protein